MFWYEVQQALDLSQLQHWLIDQSLRTIELINNDHWSLGLYSQVSCMRARQSSGSCHDHLLLNQLTYWPVRLKFHEICWSSWSNDHEVLIKSLMSWSSSAGNPVTGQRCFFLNKIKWLSKKRYPQKIFHSYYVIFKRHYVMHMSIPKPKITA